jgi:hypothetical protein
MAVYHILNDDSYVTYEQLLELVRSPQSWNTTVLEYIMEMHVTKDQTLCMSVPFDGDVVTSIAANKPCQLILTVWGASTTIDMPCADDFVNCPINLLRIGSSHHIGLRTSNPDLSMVKIKYKAFADINYRRQLSSYPDEILCIHDLLQDHILQRDEACAWGRE